MSDDAGVAVPLPEQLAPQTTAPAAPSAMSNDAGIDSAGRPSSAPAPAAPPDNRGFIQRATDWTGLTDSRTPEPNVPEWTGVHQDILSNPVPHLEDMARQFAAYAVFNDPRETQKQITHAVVGAHAVFDDKHNPMIEYQGQRFYVDKPGLSPANVINGLTYILGSEGLGAVFRFGNGVIRRFGTSAATKEGEAWLSSVVKGARPRAVGSISRAVGSAAKGLGGVELQQLGQKAFDPTGESYLPNPIEAAAGTLAGPVADFIVAPVIKQVLNLAATGANKAVIQPLLNRFRDGTAQWLTPDGKQLTQTAQAVLKQAGVPDERLLSMKPDELAALQKGFADRGLGDIATPAKQAAASAQTGEVLTANQPTVRLTRAQQTGDMGLWREQARTREGAYGGPAQQVIKDFEQLQRGDLAAMVERAAGKAGGTDVIPREGAVGGSLVDTLRASEQASSNAVGNAYTTARKTIDEAGGLAIKPGDVSLFSANAQKAIGEGDVPLVSGAGPENLPQTRNALRALSNLNRPMGTGFAPASTPTLQSLEATRRMLSDMVGSAKDASDRRGAKIVLESFDETLNDVMRSRMLGIGGNSGAAGLDALKQARELAAAHFQKFGSSRSKDPVEKTLQDWIDGGEINTQAVVNKLVGSTGVGPPSADSVNLLNKVRDAVGPDSPAWNDLRGAAMRRMVYGDPNKQAVPKTAGEWTGMLSNMNRALEGQGEQFITKLLTPEELASMKTVRTMLQRLEYPANVANRPGTAAAIADIFRKSAFGRLMLLGTGAVSGIDTMLGSPVAGAVGGALPALKGALPWLASSPALATVSGKATDAMNKAIAQRLVKEGKLPPGLLSVETAAKPVLKSKGESLLFDRENQ